MLLLSAVEYIINELKSMSSKVLINTWRISNLKFAHDFILKQKFSWIYLVIAIEM